MHLGLIRRHSVIAVAVLLLGVATGLVLLLRHGSGDMGSGYRVVMRPARPLGHRACEAEKRRLRMVFADFPCTTGAGQPWFRIVVTNRSDGDGYPVCRATAYDSAGKPLFDRLVPIEVVGGEPSGPPVSRGTTLRLIWYFDPPNQDPSYAQKSAWSVDDISRYTVTCRGRPPSQVPI